MKKYYCDVCKKDITNEHYTLTIKIDDSVVSYADICDDLANKIEKEILGE